MAGIYIPNMQMPNKCEFIYICANGTAFKRVIGLTEHQQIAHAIQVPDHGRCVDADKLTTYMLNEHYNYREVVSWKDILNAPTIIEADTNKINKEEQHD